MKTVPLVTFNELEPALNLQRLLKEKGFATVILDETKLERFGFMSEPFAAIHIEVPQPDYLAARNLVEEWDKRDGILNSAVRCPDCHSPRVEFPQITRKFISPMVIGLMMKLHLVSPHFYCLDCHFTWPTVTVLELKRDVLGWPNEAKPPVVPRVVLRGDM